MTDEAPPMTQEPTMKAEQRHREAAADLGFEIEYFTEAGLHNCKAGFKDDDPTVQAFVKFDAARTARIDQCDLATAIADRFLCQPKEMAWEDRTYELAGAVLEYLRASAFIASLKEQPHG